MAVLGTAGELFKRVTYDREWIFCSGSIKRRKSNIRQSPRLVRVWRISEAWKVSWLEVPLFDSE